MELDMALRMAAFLQGVPPNPVDITTLTAMAADLKRVGGTRAPAATVARVMEKRIGADEAMEYARMAFDANILTQAEYSAMRDYLIPRIFLPAPSQEPLRAARTALGLPVFPPKISDWRPGQPFEEAPLPSWIRRTRATKMPWRTEATEEELKGRVRAPGNPGGNPGHNPGYSNPGPLGSTEFLARKARLVEAGYVLSPVQTAASQGWDVDRVRPHYLAARASLVRLSKYAPYLLPYTNRLVLAEQLLTTDRLPQFRQEITAIMDAVARDINQLGAQQERAITEEEERARIQAWVGAEQARARAAVGAPPPVIMRAPWLPKVATPVVRPAYPPPLRAPGFRKTY